MLLRGACFTCLEENHGNRGGNPPSCRGCVGLRAVKSTERRWSNHRLSPCEPRLGFITRVQGLMHCRCVANRSWQIFDSAGWSNPPLPSSTNKTPSSSSPQENDACGLTQGTSMNSWERAMRLVMSKILLKLFYQIGNVSTTLPPSLTCVSMHSLARSFAYSHKI